MRTGKKGFFLSGMVLFLSVSPMVVSAEIPQSYLDEICGEWYLQREGYLFRIEPSADPNFVQMTVEDLNGDHVHTDWDTGEYQRLYYLTVDTEYPDTWLCEDGRLDIAFYAGSSFWVTVNEELEQEFYNGEHMFSLNNTELEEEELAEYYTGTEDFYGSWISNSTGEILQFMPIPGSRDVYGSTDYVVSRGNVGDDGSMTVDTSLVMTRTQDKMEHRASPYERDYFLLKSFHIIECYDQNGKLTDTLEKRNPEEAAGEQPAETEASGTSGALMPRSETYQAELEARKTIDLMEGTYTGDGITVTIQVDERYSQNHAYNDFVVLVTYFDPQTLETTVSDRFFLDNQRTNWGYLYGLAADQEESGYNIIKTDNRTIQFRIEEEVICELKQEE
ncbi:MAG: hypothetical protein SOZ59_00805 [Candidatus Limivivens sp.]|nr:hypothetical protein [Candidatus Limivivens sp.]